MQSIVPGLLPRQNLEEALGKIFPTSREETRTQRARQILGEEIRGLPDDELEVHLTQFQYLIDSWIDEYEKGVFDGQTLRQVLQEE